MMFFRLRFLLEVVQFSLCWLNVFLFNFNDGFCGVPNSVGHDKVWEGDYNGKELTQKI